MGASIINYCDILINALHIKSGWVKQGDFNCLPRLIIPVVLQFFLIGTAPIASLHTMASTLNHIILSLYSTFIKTTLKTRIV